MYIEGPIQRIVADCLKWFGYAVEFISIFFIGRLFSLSKVNGLDTEGLALC